MNNGSSPLTFKDSVKSLYAMREMQINKGLYEGGTR